MGWYQRRYMGTLQHSTPRKTHTIFSLPRFIATMPDYKLTYLNMQGRAELARWCLAYGGIPYVDDRLEFSEWPARKKEMPGGQVPVLDIDGVPLPESLAIARYCANQAGLVPQDAVQAAYCDSAVDTISALGVELAQKIIFSKAEAAEKHRILDEELVPNKFNPLLKRLNERLTNQDWFISDRVTWADLAIGLMFGNLTLKVPDLLKNYPNVRRLVDEVKALTPIKKWLRTRPVTEN